MNADEALVALVGVLEALAIPYMVSGSLAANAYGVPRATDDGDFVLELPPGGRIADIAAALPDTIRLEPPRHPRAARRDSAVDSRRSRRA